MRGLIPLFTCALLVATACGDSSTNDDDGAGGSTTSSVGGAGGMRDPLPLKVATWNVQNLFDDQMDGAMFEDTDPQWEEHVADIAAVLNVLDADVVVLQEVEHTAIVGAVRNQLNGGYVFHEVIDGNDPRGIDVGVISKVQPDALITHKDDTFAKVGTQDPFYRYARDALEIQLTFNGRRLVLFGVHYKSKEADDPDKRLAEAQHTRALADAVTAEDPSAGVIILGDFNDLPGSPPLDFTLGSAPDAYTSIADNIAAADRWTFNFMGALELVDHQLVNGLVAGMLDTASVRILHGPEVDAASDHAPLIATYNVH